MLLEKAGKTLDGAKPLLLGAYGQGLPLGGKGKGDLLLILLDDL